MTRLTGEIEDRGHGPLSITGPAGAASEPASLFHPGEVLGRSYEILSQIGAGGMGCVYEARDLNLNRLVAIKAAHASIPREELRQEARVLAAFRHPGLTTIFAFGTHREMDYLVMEKLPGVTLLDHMNRRGKLSFSTEEVIEILIAIGETLAVLHSAGLAHRDVKPENIMLAGRGRVVLLDCGIARQERYIAEDRIISGSPEHMAPETVRASVRTGEAHLVDLYGLAVVAFELLTMRALFPAKSTVETLQQQMSSEAPRVSQLRPSVPAALDSLIADMLEKKPEDRPPTIEVVNAALRTIRAGLHVHGTPGSTGAERALPAPISVLLVDDDPEIKSLVSILIRRAVPDADIRLAGNGAEAIKLLQERAPDLMFLDLQMPVMNGLEVCMYLRGARLAERTTIVVLSADLDSNKAILTQLGVADTMLSKRRPVELANTIRQLVSRIQRARAAVMHTVGSSQG